VSAFHYVRNVLMNNDVLDDKKLVLLAKERIP
jgi:hypothetical protein